MSGERRCEACTVCGNRHEAAFYGQCGALVVEGPCRALAGRCRHERVVHGQRWSLDDRTYCLDCYHEPPGDDLDHHEYDGWVCESGHELAASEAVTG